MTIPTVYFDPVLAMWPEDARKPLAPVRVGMDAKTGKILVGWRHVRQSLDRIFATPFHTRVLRRWVGSFVPHILGEEGVPDIILRFHWAIASAIDLWEPCYRVKRVQFQGYALEGQAWSPPPETDGVEMFRLGHVIFRNEGIYMPRGHLGDFTPASTFKIGLIQRGHPSFDVTSVGPGV
jgi:Bacteriophage baseplate protein W